MSSSNGCTDVVHGQTVVSDNYGLDGLDTISETLVDEVCVFSIYVGVLTMFS